MPPSNVLFWHKDYFELKSTENKQIKEKLSDFYVLKSSAKICKKKKNQPCKNCDRINLRCFKHRDRDHLLEQPQETNKHLYFAFCK